MKTALAGSSFNESAENRWYILVQSGYAPVKKELIVDEVRLDFFFGKIAQLSGNKPLVLVLICTDSIYVNIFMSIVIAISIITKDERPDKFGAGLRPMLNGKVLRAPVRSFIIGFATVLNVDSALYVPVVFRNVSSYSQHYRSQLVGIVKTDTSPYGMEKAQRNL